MRGLSRARTSVVVAALFDLRGRLGWLSSLPELAVRSRWRRLDDAPSKVRLVGSVDDLGARHIRLSVMGVDVRPDAQG